MESNGKWKLVSVLGDGLVTLDLQDRGNQIWVRTSRKGTGKTCLECGKDLTDQLSYRPVGNPGNRGQRICVQHVEEEISKLTVQ
jgi:hypothetical protein